MVAISIFATWKVARWQRQAHAWKTKRRRLPKKWQDVRKLTCPRKQDHLKRKCPLNQPSIFRRLSLFTSIVCVCVVCRAFRAPSEFRVIMKLSHHPRSPGHFRCCVPTVSTHQDLSQNIRWKLKSNFQMLTQKWGQKSWSRKKDPSFPLKCWLFDNGSLYWYLIIPTYITG